jgi:hypothetical protein
MLRQPASGFRGFVAGGVVEHEVHVELGGDVLIDRLQELQELDRAVTRVQLADHLATLNVQRGVQAGGAVPPIIVRGAFGGAGQHRQDRRGAVQRLDLRFLVDRQHDGALGRVQVQADDVVDLLDELRVLGELPALVAVGLQPERVPDPHHRIRCDPDLFGHRPRRPVRRVLRRALKRGDHDPFDLLVGDRSRPTRPWLIRQPLKPAGSESVAPLGHRRTRDTQRLGDLQVGRPPAAASTIRARNASACALVCRRV